MAYTDVTGSMKPSYYEALIAPADGMDPNFHEFVGHESGLPGGRLRVGEGSRYCPFCKNGTEVVRNRPAESIEEISYSVGIRESGMPIRGLRQAPSTRSIETAVCNMMTGVICPSEFEGNHRFLNEHLREARPVEAAIGEFDGPGGNARTTSSWPGSGA